MRQKLNSQDSELYKRTDEVLHYIWDPIGVREEPFARDEYWIYLPQVFSLVKAGDKKGILAYLLDVETVQMGMTGKKKNAEHVAEILLNWHEKIFGSNT